MLSMVADDVVVAATTAAGEYPALRQFINLVTEKKNLKINEKHLLNKKKFSDTKDI
jgi:hypothetical protein